MHPNGKSNYVRLYEIGAEISHREKKEKGERTRANKNSYLSFCTSSILPAIKECIVSEDKPRLTTDNNGVKALIR